LKALLITSILVDTYWKTFWVVTNNTWLDLRLDHLRTTDLEYLKAEQSFSIINQLSIIFKVLMMMHLAG